MLPKFECFMIIDKERNNKNNFQLNIITTLFFNIRITAKAAIDAVTSSGVIPACD